MAAVNFTDSPSATPRTASWACSAMAIQRGAEPVMQIAARDRTRVGLQSEVMGAADLGIRNILCISGDSMKMAPAPRGRMDIIDIDAIQMLWILRRMRDEGKYMDGREIKTPPQFFLGAAASPFASEPKFQALREHKKVNAGAQFFQTNLVFDVAHMEVWLNELAKRNILDKVYILIGITPLKTLKMAQYMNEEVPGVFDPGGAYQAHGSGGESRQWTGRGRADRAGADREDQEVRGQGRQWPAHHGGWLGGDRAAHRHRSGASANETEFSTGQNGHAIAGNNFPNITAK